MERIAGWSARRRKSALFGCLLLVAVVFVAGHALGIRSVPAYNAGQSGQAQRTLQQLTGNASAAPTESVLIQAKKIDLKILGVGMAAAILIDATLVRGILLPAALALVGDRAWSAPSWLRRPTNAGSLQYRSNRSAS